VVRLVTALGVPPHIRKSHPNRQGSSLRISSFAVARGNSRHACDRFRRAACGGSLKRQHRKRIQGHSLRGWQLYPDVRTVFEIGGGKLKILCGWPRTATRSTLPDPNTHTYATGITDYSTSGECAAGTGSFLDQQASRLKYRVEEIGDVVAQAKCARGSRGAAPFSRSPT